MNIRNSTKEVKLVAYKTYIRPVLEYAVPVRDRPVYANEHWQTRKSTEKSRQIYF